MEQVIIIKKEHGMQNSGEEEADKKDREKGIVQKSTLLFCTSNISQKILFSWRTHAQ